jgi:type II secretory pathway component GspD/PulD (secretin)
MARKSVVAALVLAFAGTVAAAPSQAQTIAARTPEQKTVHEIVLSNIASRNDEYDVIRPLITMFPDAQIRLIPSRNTIFIRSTEQDYEAARQMIDKLTQARGVYRLTYTVTRRGRGTTSGPEVTGPDKLTLTVAQGNHASLKCGSKVPVITGSQSTASGSTNRGQYNQVQYIDTGINIFADLSGPASSLILQTKVEESAPEPGRSANSGGDPVIAQTVLDNTTLLAPGKPQVIGSLDLPGTSESEQITVLAEPVR